MKILQFFHKYQKLPFITVIVALCTLFVSITSLNQTFQYDRVALATGKYWLILTCHLSHWSADNLFWDLLVFVVIGIIAECRSRKGFVLCLGLSGVLIPILLWFFLTDVDCYRGISGLDSALFGFVVLSMAKERLTCKNYKGAVMILAIGGAFVLKIVFEIITSEALFAESSGLFVPVPLAHLTGAFVGICVALYIIPSFFSNRRGDYINKQNILLL